MRHIFIVSVFLVSIFSSTFLLIKFSGIITMDDITQWLTGAADSNAIYVGIIIVCLLFSDLFIAIPTMTICMLSGYFLGTFAGTLVSAAGMMFAGVVGYSISFYYGEVLLLKIYKNPQTIQYMQKAFNSHANYVILLCRALPILPELVTCLAGINKITFSRFLLFYSISTLPYAFITAWAGSYSSLTNPKPAIFTAIGLSLFLWISWLLFLRHKRSVINGVRLDNS